jgi:hypothetical protein
MDRIRKVSDDLHSKLRERKGSMNEWRTLVLISLRIFTPKRADLGMVKIARCKTPGLALGWWNGVTTATSVSSEILVYRLNEYKTRKPMESL